MLLELELLFDECAVLLRMRFTNLEFRPLEFAELPLRDIAADAGRDPLDLLSVALEIALRAACSAAFCCCSRVVAASHCF